MRNFAVIFVAVLWVFCGKARAEDFVALGRTSDGYFYKGTTQTGANFTITKDGGGELLVVGGQPEGRGEIWKISCDKDAMYDRASCNVDWFSPPMIRFHLVPKIGVTGICVTNTVLMARGAMFRVAMEKPIVTDRSGCLSGAAARSMFAKLSEGADLRVRTFHFDEGGTNIVDAEAIVTQHFSEAIGMMRFLESGGSEKIQWEQR